MLEWTRMPIQAAEKSDCLGYLYTLHVHILVFKNTGEATRNTLKDICQSKIYGLIDIFYEKKWRDANKFISALLPVDI